MAPLWENCADIDFGYVTPKISMISAPKYVRSLGVQAEDLLGISAVFETRNQVIRLAISRKDVCEAFIEMNAGVRTEIIEGREIKISVKDSNIVEKFVRLTGIPYTLDLGIVKRRLKEFGTVFDLRWERYHVASDEYLFPVLSTWLIVRMSVEKDIPSYLTIGEYRAIIKYYGQPLTCKLCDSRTHLVRDCPTSKRHVTTQVVVPTDNNQEKRNKTRARQEEEAAVTQPHSSDTAKEVIDLVESPENVSIEIPAAQPVPTIISETQASISESSIGSQNLVQSSLDEVLDDPMNDSEMDARDRTDSLKSLDSQPPSKAQKTSTSSRQQPNRNSKSNIPTSTGRKKPNNNN
jgi:hypothetical protein